MKRGELTGVLDGSPWPAITVTVDVYPVDPDHVYTRGEPVGPKPTREGHLGYHLAITQAAGKAVMDHLKTDDGEQLLRDHLAAMLSTLDHRLAVQPGLVDTWPDLQDQRARLAMRLVRRMTKDPQIIEISTGLAADLTQALTASQLIEAAQLILQRPAEQAAGR